MKIRWMGMLVVVVLLAAACGSDDSGQEVGSGGSEGDLGVDADVSSDDADGSAGTSGGSSVADDSANGDGDGPDDDLGEIAGNPDLENLPDEIEDIGDEIAGIVSIGDCVATTIGIGIEVPEGWRCRVLDNPVPGLDGFTLFTDGNLFNITIGSPSPIGSPCELVPGLCTNEGPIEIPGFGDAVTYETAGSGNIIGLHDTYEADLVVTKTTTFTEEDLGFIRDVLATLGEV